MGEFTVRGLSLPDLSHIMRMHGTALEAIYLENIVKADDKTDSFSMASIGNAVIQSAPEAVALAIALAADEPNLITLARKLPVAAQADAIEKILALTFYTEDALGNLIGTVLRGSESVQRVLSRALPEAVSGPGSEESVEA
jgi:hypothetical protein